MGCGIPHLTRRPPSPKDRGFLRPNVIGSFNQRSAARGGMATGWVLTEFPVGEDKGAGTRDFMRWTLPAARGR